MAKPILVMATAILLATLSGAASQSGKLRCTLTGKIINSCCCTTSQNGNLHCTLAKKDIKSCCCESAQK